MSFSNPFGIDVFELVLFLVEFSHYAIAVVAVLVFFAFPSGQSRPNANPSSHAKDTTGTSSSTYRGYPATKKVTATLLLLPGFVLTVAGSVILSSWEDAYFRGYDIFKNPSLRTKLENYISTGNDDLTDILESNKYAPTFGIYEVKYLLRDLLRHTFFHTDHHNENNIDEGYNKGNDWFKATLGETMMYTSGLFPKGNETLQEAQDYKIDFVADALQLEHGMTVLDVGCGWSYLAKRLTEKHGAAVTGITLSTEQLAHAKTWNQNKNTSSPTILLQDAMELHKRKDLPAAGFDRITSLEMAEHVGIRRYQEFLKIIHGMLKDDGVFYFQVAGLRRAWQFEDFVWGLFMGEHVFPGADASCPLAWISTQIERAGFEIQRVHNMGTHYSRTLQHWLDNWHRNREYIEETYGAVAYRRWEVFLHWSVRAARQGSSTLFMFTLTKAGAEERRIKSQNHLVPKNFPTMGGLW